MKTHATLGLFALPTRLPLFLILPVLALTLAASPDQGAFAAGVGIDTGQIETPPVAEAPSTEWRFRIGLGIAAVPDYVGSNDYRLAPVPQATASKGPQYVNLTGTYVSSNALPSTHWRLGPTAKFIRGDRCNAEDDKVNDQNCQADALMLGASGGYAFHIAGMGGESARLEPALEILGDVAGANDGVTIEPQINYNQKLSERWRMGLRGSATWGSENYESYYFGVDRFQAQDSGLDQHDADAGFQQVGVLGVFDYDITQNWRLSLIARYSRMVGDAEDSPLVNGNDGRGSANQLLGGVIVSYAW